MDYKWSVTNQPDELDRINEKIKHLLVGDCSIGGVILEMVELSSRYHSE